MHSSTSGNLNNSGLLGLNSSFGAQNYGNTLETAASLLPNSMLQGSMFADSQNQITKANPLDTPLATLTSQNFRNIHAPKFNYTLFLAIVRLSFAFSD
jgi:hypothetical protein